MRWWANPFLFLAIEPANRNIEMKPMAKRKLISDPIVVLEERKPGPPRKLFISVIL